MNLYKTKLSSLTTKRKQWSRDTRNAYKNTTCSKKKKTQKEKKRKYAFTHNFYIKKYGLVKMILKGNYHQFSASNIMSCIQLTWWTIGQLYHTLGIWTLFIIIGTSTFSCPVTTYLSTPKPLSWMCLSQNTNYHKKRRCKGKHMQHNYHMSECRWTPKETYSFAHHNKF